MVRKDEIIEGRYLRTLSDSFSVPVGTIAKVDSGWDHMARRVRLYGALAGLESRHASQTDI